MRPAVLAAFCWPAYRLRAPAILPGFTPESIRLSWSRIRIHRTEFRCWGVFSLANPNDRNSYRPAARGYLYLKIERNPEATRNEWNDLKQVAGSGEVVAFLGRFSPGPRLRRPEEKPDEPDPYMLNIGVTKVRSRTDYPPVRALLDFKD